MNSRDAHTFVQGLRGLVTAKSPDPEAALGLMVHLAHMLNINPEDGALRPAPSNGLIHGLRDGYWEAVGIGNGVGAPGPKGDRGPEGPEGQPGEDGEQGEQGPRGERGPPGPSGETGPKGDRGPQGSIGPQGSQGNRGDSGPPGIQGKQGIAGLPGLRGETGLPGSDGPTGSEGRRGPTGSQGQAGRAGPAGPPGLQGPEGLPGKPCVIATIVGEFHQEPKELPSDGIIPKDWDRKGSPHKEMKVLPGQALLHLTHQDVWLFTGVQPMSTRGWVNLGCAFGEPGPRGPAGQTGHQGPQGLPGHNGQDGEPGPSRASSDPGNLAQLGTDGLLYVSPTITGRLETQLEGIRDRLDRLEK